MQGLHLTADLFGCQCPTHLLTDETLLKDLCVTQILAVGLTIVGEKWHTFDDYQGQPGGVTGTVLLAESHLAIHSWPERNGVTLDVYVCNFEADNSSKAQALMDELVKRFNPTVSELNHLNRGGLDLLQAATAQAATDQMAETHADTESTDTSEQFIDWLNATSFYGHTFDACLEKVQSPYQEISVFNSKELGKTLCIDGHFMTSERDEFFYHEALIHPAAIAHPQPEKALIIGGGDGGALEELLKHPSIKEATLVELDGTVIDLSKKYLGSIHNNAFDNPKAHIRIEDGLAYIQNTDQRYDLIYLDLTDPETPAGPLYTEEFFRSCKKALNPQGILTLHLGSPFHESDQVKRLLKELSAVFQQCNAYGLHIPLYGSYWGLATASNETDVKHIAPDLITDRLACAQITDLKYYNSATHAGLFALPGFFKNMTTS